MRCSIPVQNINRFKGSNDHPSKVLKCMIRRRPYKPRVVMETIMKSLLKSMAIYAAIATVLFSSGKMLATGLDSMVDSARDLNDAMNYCVTALVDDAEDK